MQLERTPVHAKRCFLAAGLLGTFFLVLFAHCGGPDKGVDTLNAGGSGRTSGVSSGGVSSGGVSSSGSIGSGSISSGSTSTGTIAGPLDSGMDSTMATDAVTDSNGGSSDTSLPDTNGEASDAPVCEAGLTSCGGVCVNTEKDANHCGQCGNACMGMNSACIGGTCACQPGFDLCQGQCSDYTSDPSNCGYCMHNCQGGKCAMSHCLPIQVVQHAGTPGANLGLFDVAVSQSFVYWTTGSDVYYQSLTGNGAATKINASPEANPTGLALGPQYLYWVDFGSGAVRANVTAQGMPILGGNDVYLVGGDGGAPSSKPGSFDAVIDSKRIYWVNSRDGTVNAMNLDGTGVVTQLATGQTAPGAIAIDANNVYWVNYGSMTGSTGSVNRIAINIVDAGAPVTIAMDQDKPFDIAVDGNFVYWTAQDNPGAVLRAPVDGSVPGTVPTKLAGGGDPSGIALGQGAMDLDVYWTNKVDGTVVAMVRDGSKPAVTLASGQQDPVAIAVTEKSVYWATTGDGAIWKVAK